MLIETQARTSLNQVAPQFRVPDVMRTAEWYRDHLGFAIGDYFFVANGEQQTPVFVHLRRDGVVLQVGRSESGRVSSNQDATPFAMDAYIWVSGIPDLFEECRARGVTFLYELHKTEYDMWEFAMLDCDGHSIGFGELPAR